MAVDVKQVSAQANNRPENASYEHGDVKALGSRVTARQTQLVLDTATRGQKDKLVGDDEKLDALRGYADTGNRSYLSGEQSEVLKSLVTAAREKVENESQKRRIWPRKVAAVLVADKDSRAAA